LKRILALLLLLLLTCTACSLAPDSYLSVTPHTGSGSQTEVTDAVSVEDYAGLRRAILGFISMGQTEGTIRASNYDGSVEKDLADAVYEMSKQYPLGAYAVDYMSYDCIYIVNYYEINIHTTFRRTVREIAEIEDISTETGLQLRIQRALNETDNRIVIRMEEYREMDIPAIVAAHCADRPGTILEQPKVSVSVYPDSGETRILEINLLYTHTAEELKNRTNAMKESIDAAAEYIRYRETNLEKAELLFTYLMERFTYKVGETVTPVYDALCSGIADPAGLSHAWQLICDRAGLECYTVSGLRDGEPYLWNIISVDGEYRHLDLAQSMLSNGMLILKTDPEMTQYYWNMDAYPACEHIEEEPLPTEQPDTPVEEETPSEETPSEETLPEKAEPETTPESETPPEPEAHETETEEAP